MTFDQFTMGQVALAAWRAAPRVDPSANVMRAIAWVIRNRVKAGWMGGDWMAVLQEEGNYSYTTEFSICLPPFGDRTFERLLVDVTRIYEGTMTPDPSRGALWWAEPNRILRDWFLENIVRARNENRDLLHPPVAQVGPITLYA